MLPPVTDARRISPHLVPGIGPGDAIRPDRCQRRSSYGTTKLAAPSGRITPSLTQVLSCC